ncbi:MAG: hypothetical protein HY760_05365 [Nitrospirae bacterium]|nr:hypothetical protein [Nitrospirota bacterium]
MKNVWLAAVLVGLLGCGSDTPFDAQIVGPSDEDVTVYDADGFDFLFTKPLIFKVLNADGDKPLPGLDIEFYADGVLSDKDGNAIGTAMVPGGSYLKTKTDDQGLAAVPVFDGFPACDADADITYTTLVHAVSGPASATWTGSVTVPMCPVVP